MNTINQIIVSGDRSTLGPCRSFKVQAISGECYAVFDGNEVTLFNGFNVELPLGMLWSKVEVFAASGASVTVHYGLVSFGGSGGSGSGGVQSTSGSPEGVLDASNGQIAWDSSTGTLYLNENTSGNTGWEQFG